MTHTPGPWVLAEYDGQVVEVMSAHDTDIAFFPRTPEGMANARLIASAPDLLKALKAVLSDCQVAAPSPHFRWDDEYYAAFNQARAAVAKATETDR